MGYLPWPFLRNKQKLIRREEEFSQEFSGYAGNTLEGSGPVGIACGGISYAYVKEAIAGQEERFTILKIATPYPFPDALADRFMAKVNQIFVFEELDPVIEDALIFRLGRKSAGGSQPEILGKRAGTVPAAGELSAEIVATVLKETAGIETVLSAAASTESTDSPPDLPVRPPVLCPGCPHRGSFYAVKAAVKQALRTDDPGFTQAVFHGDIGCYTLGNAAPLNMVDTCLCMGAGITMAQGMNHADANTLNFAFVGDSTFFASGITGTVNAVYNQADMILCILDNSTTAMTGHQPHPGMGITMMGQRVEPVDIHKVLEGIGVPWIRTVDPLDHKASVDAVTEAIGRKGVRAIIFKSPCIALFKATGICTIDAGRCVGCMRCINEIGCPALAPGQILSDKGKRTVEINPGLCIGCGLCAQLCPTGSIGLPVDRNSSDNCVSSDAPSESCPSDGAPTDREPSGKEATK